MSFRFLHTADWQIGKPFANVPGDAGAALRAQRIATVAEIARLAATRQLDAVLVAGDIFDSNEVHDRTILRTLDALKAFTGRWIFLPGNHDAALAHSVWTRMRQMGIEENIIIADQPVPITGWDGRATILPAPLRRRRESEDQTEWFDSAATVEGALRVGLAHGSVANRLPGAAEASNEIPENRAETARLGYLALGDWHGALKIAPRTYYSGTPETDRHRANQSGFVQIVELDGVGAPERVELVGTSHFSWHDLDAELIEGTADAVSALLGQAVSDPARAVVALALTGSLSLAERYRLNAELETWRNRLHHLDLDGKGLVEDPTEDDLDSLDTSGFVRLALERLKARANDPSDPKAPAARVALRMVYLDHRQSGGVK
ncbi:DNA repair exonuclease [Kaistia dalseonensis]|uniref:DNA repair exonuclease SbcCD nuclease subunit n=1 Tax=Kaistia dalseonensis TaxID=410840 RepID=A0ABU0H9A0_9HYPH|nr:DNA repair exonuclease [Kaistia dalseonensis]MCX5496276.1 DNA repair exonuclease [Kaistia dalseonensis]MDQ0438894.1 DNA repair exonuclease SbcCD nuclease subunit [Kaistia dalseonensis]